MPSFTQKIYEVVKKIPSGKTMTYAEVAKLAGNPAAVRATGNALNKNKSPDIPCHRVIRSDGTVGGFNRGTQKKLELLKKEDVIGLKSDNKTHTNNK